MKRFRRVGHFAIVALLSAVVSCFSESSIQGEDLVDGVVVILGVPALTVGETVQAAAIARSASDRPIAGVTIAWSSTNPAVASVSSFGLVVALAPGTTQIAASAAGYTGSTTLTAMAADGLSPAVTAPEPGAGDVILVQDNFERPAASIASGYGTRGTVIGTDGHASATAIRFAYSPGSDDNLIEKGFAETKDVYFRFWYRTSPGADPTCGGKNAPGFKWFMPWRSDPNPRYTMGVGMLDYEHNAGLEFSTHDNSSALQPNPNLQNVAKSPRFGTTNDGRWHKYTLHVVTGDGGYEQIWVDDTKVLDNQGAGYDHSAIGISLIQFPGAVVNFSGCSNFTIDVDDLAIWHK